MSIRSNLTGRTSARTRIASSMIVALAVSSVAHAVDYNFVGPVATPADYNIAANWSPAVVPTATDAGFISGGRIAAITAGADAINTLSIGANGSAGTGELRLSAGSLTASSIQLGHDAGTTTAGMIKMTGGTLTANQVVMGEQGTGDNSIAVSGGTLTFGGESFLGANGNGSLVVSGTANVSTQRLNVANALNSTGLLSISSGTLTMNGKSYIGLRGAGTFNISGGTVTGGADLGVGQENDTGGGAPVSRGIINVSGGNSTFGTVVLGEVSSGDNQLNVTGGTFKTNGDLYNGANGKGSVTISGASSIVNIGSQMHIGASPTGNGSLTMSGGTLNMTGNGDGGWILVGQNGTGTFNFSGGTITTNRFTVGQDPSSTGTATMTGGMLRSRFAMVVGEVTPNNNVMSVSGGTVEVGTDGADPDGNGIFVGSYGNGRGTLNISNTAAVSVHNGITIGYGPGNPSDGTINVSGGSFTTLNPGIDGRARIGVYAGTTGKLNVSGGTVAFAGPILSGVNFDANGVGGVGLINVTGGSLAAASMVNETGSTFTQSAGTSTLGAVTGGGAMTVSGGTSTVTRLTQSAVTVSGTGTLKIANAATPAASIVSTLTTAGTGKLDISNNGLIVDYTGATSPINAIRQALLAGRIVGTLTPADARQSVAYGEASALTTTATTGGAFIGTPVDGTAIVLRSRLKGDANLDGSVEFQDLVALSQNYNATGNAVWTMGDFDYDGDVDFQDLIPLAQNYNGSLLTGDIGTASFQADWALAQSLVPEPTSLIAVSAGAFVAARRRRA